MLLAAQGRRVTERSEAPALTLGILATSRKPDERRLPIHPDHFARIDPASGR